MTCAAFLLRIRPGRFSHDQLTVAGARHPDHIVLIAVVQVPSHDMALVQNGLLGGFQVVNIKGEGLSPTVWSNVMKSTLETSLALIL